MTLKFSATGAAFLIPFLTIFLTMTSKLGSGETFHLARIQLIIRSSVLATTGAYLTSNNQRLYDKLPMIMKAVRVHALCKLPNLPVKNRLYSHVWHTPVALLSPQCMGVD